MSILTKEDVAQIRVEMKNIEAGEGVNLATALKLVETVEQMHAERKERIETIEAQGVEVKRCQDGWDEADREYVALRDAANYAIRTDHAQLVTDRDNAIARMVNAETKVKESREAMVEGVRLREDIWNRRDEMEQQRDRAREAAEDYAVIEHELRCIRLEPTANQGRHEFSWEREGGGQ